MTEIQLYDATLRDGMQGEGMVLSAEEKLRVAHKLDELGIDLIEAGFPGSNPKDRELFALLERESFRHAAIAAFGMTRRRDVEASQDPALIELVGSVAPVCTLVGKTWTLHLEKLVKVDREENLRMIDSSIAFLRASGKRVVYDAEHFFDGYRAEPEYALRCIRAAAEAGAETVTLCDTNGSSLPSQIAAATAAAIAALGAEVRVGIHCHNDAECGVANTLAAVEVGARQVQGTMNGCGERTGNANLVSIIANLQLKLGFRCLTDEQLARLTETAHFVDELLNVTPDPNQPYVGRNAFAHKGGMHVAGVSADASHLRAHRPGAGRQPARAAGLGASGPRQRQREGGGARYRAGRGDHASGCSSGSRSSSTAATSSRPPTARSSCCCAARRAATSRCSGSSPGG